MKTRSYQKLYNYLFGALADIDESIKNTPEEYKEKLRLAKSEEIIQFFFAKSEPLIQEADRVKFRNALKNFNAKFLEKILYKDADTPSSKENLEDKSQRYPLPSSREIEEKFNDFEKNHAFFTKEKYELALEQFKVYFRITLIIADFVEHNNTRNNDVAFEHAYKMLVLFGDKSDPKKVFHYFDLYVKSHNLYEKQRALHDSFVWNLPSNIQDQPSIHLAEWRKIIRDAGPRGCRIFSRATEIEKKLSGNAPQDFTEAFNICKSITYKKFDEDRELADLCMTYDINEEIFNRCLELKKTMKKSDKLPQIVVDGSEVDKPGYFLVKLPINDPRAFILGHITDCCQSIGGHSESCVKDGISKESNGFYVLLRENTKIGFLKKKTPLKIFSDDTKATDEKNAPEPMPKKELQSPFIQTSSNAIPQIDYSKYKIVGQGYAWLSQWKNLVFDSWENLRPAKEEKKGDVTVISLQDDGVIVPMLQKFSQLVFEEKDTDILRVTIGRGGKTPDFFMEYTVSKPEEMFEGEQYNDSKEQCLIACNVTRRKKLYQAVMQDIKSALKESKIEINLENLIKEEDILSEPHANLLTDKNKLLFLSKYKNSDISNYIDKAYMPTNWLAITLLNEAGVYTEEVSKHFLKMILSSTKTYDLIYKPILILHKANLLKDYFKVLLDSQKWQFDWHEHAESFVLLKDIGFLNDHYVNMILYKIENSYIGSLLCQALSELKKADLLIQPFLDEVLAMKNSYNTLDFGKALVELKKFDLLKDPYLNMLREMKSKDNVLYFSQALSELKQADLLTDENVNFVMNSRYKDPLSAAKTLIAIAKKTDISNFNYEEALISACKKSDAELAKLIIDSNLVNIQSPKLVNGEKSSYSGGLLHIAAENESISVMKLLLECKMPIDAKRASDGCTPVQIAAADTWWSFNFLTSQKADINIPDKTGRTPLIKCIDQNSYEQIPALLEYKDIKIEKEKLLDSEYFLCAQKYPNRILTAKTIVALYEKNLLNIENYKFVDNTTYEKKGIINFIINNYYDLNKFDDKVLTFLQELLSAATKDEISALENFVRLFTHNDVSLQGIDLSLLQARCKIIDAYVKAIKNNISYDTQYTPEYFNIVLQAPPNLANDVAYTLYAVMEGTAPRKTENIFLISCGKEPNIGLVDLILRKNRVDINKIVDRETGATPMAIAEQHGQSDILKLLLSYHTQTEEKQSLIQVSPLSPKR